MKIKINNRRAQATVEYVLMTVLVAGLVLSLTQFSDTIDGKLASWKSDARNKMAGLDSSQGTYDLSRSDFATPGLTMKGSSGGNAGGGTSGGATAGQEGGGGGTGEGGGGGAAAARKGGAAAGGAGAGGVGVGAPGLGVGKNQGEGSGTSGFESAGEEYDTNREAPQYSEENASTESQIGGQGSGTGGEGKKEAGQGVTAGEEGKGASASLIKRRQGEELIGGGKTLAEKDWSIGKFIIILLIIIFFIIVIVKSREMRQ